VFPASLRDRGGRAGVPSEVESMAWEECTWDGRSGQRGPRMSKRFLP
jgi:hypothetical protein